jgi:hypothetical protein
MMAVATHEISAPARIGPAEEARRFLFALYADPPQKGEWWELRCLDCRQKPAEPGPRRFYRSLQLLIDDAMRFRSRWDVYIGVGYRRCPDTHDMTRCPHKHRGEDHISRLPAVWVDVDVQSPDEPRKRYGSTLDALEALYGLSIPPKLIVGSGAGLHAYWPLAHASHDLVKIVEKNRAAAAQLQVDNCGDAPRILRLPGTFNRKHGSDLPVTLIEGPAE